MLDYSFAKSLALFITNSWYPEFDNNLGANYVLSLFRVLRTPERVRSVEYALHLIKMKKDNDQKFIINEDFKYFDFLTCFFGYVISRDVTDVTGARCKQYLGLDPTNVSETRWDNEIRFSTQTYLSPDDAKQALLFLRSHASLVGLDCIYNCEFNTYASRWPQDVALFILIRQSLEDFEAYPNQHKNLYSFYNVLFNYLSEEQIIGIWYYLKESWPQLVPLWSKLRSYASQWWLIPPEDEPANSSDL